MVLFIIMICLSAIFVLIPIVVCLLFICHPQKDEEEDVFMTAPPIEEEKAVAELYIPRPYLTYYRNPELFWTPYEQGAEA